VTESPTARALHVPSISTTAFTATVIALASGIGTWSLPARAARRLTGNIVSLAAGAFLGDWMLGHAHPYAPVVPAIVTAVVVSVASVALKPAGQPGQVAAGESPGPSDAGSPTTLTVVLHRHDEGVLPQRADHTEHDTNGRTRR
jgi:Protein of unknown function (DUF1275)